MGATRRLLLDAAEDGPPRASRRGWTVLHQNHGTAVPAIVGSSPVWVDSRADHRTLKRALPSGSGAVSKLSTVFANDGSYPHYLRGKFPSAHRAGVQPEPAKRTDAGSGSGSWI